MKAHTPAPWHVGMKPGPIVYGPQGEQVASLHVPMLDVEENKANARLIASAPELLTALEEAEERMLVALQHLNCDPCHLCEAIKAARAAIAKAKGETK